MGKLNLIRKIRRGFEKIVRLFKHDSQKQTSQEAIHVEQKYSFIQYEIDSQKLMQLFADHHYTFTIVPVMQNSEKKEQLVQYCINNPNKFILVTANQTVCDKIKTLSTTSTPTHTTSKVKTLIDAKRIGGKLFISELNSRNRNICVISKGREYNEGSCQLNIGDDVFIATKKREYCAFSHFRIISLGLENNSILVYHTRLYNMKKINDNLPRDDYRRFVRSFKLRHDI